jgi:ankyrin repeat protein
MLSSATIFALAVCMACGSRPLYATPLHDAARVGDVALARAIIMDDPSSIPVRDLRGFIALSVAAQEGHEAVVKLLLEKGAAVDTKANYRGAPPSTVAFYSSPEVVALLRVKAPVEPVGATPLYVAALEGHVAVVTLLLDNGAAIEAKAEDGGTPLAIAAQQGNLEVVRLLLEKGAVVDAKDNNGVTPLARAAQSWDGFPDRHLEIVKLLLARGADPNSPGLAPYARGKTTLQVAEEQAQAYKEIADLLRVACTKQKSSVRPCKGYAKGTSVGAQ